mmetsp:Transcript_11322/g.28624  ORF Transcript_11322/g.28624 Transcript_11322/m.28624 type:complete len:207 (-) Transcript_11322:3683-4303(-)
MQSSDPRPRWRAHQRTGMTKSALPPRTRAPMMHSGRQTASLRARQRQMRALKILHLQMQAWNLLPWGFQKEEPPRLRLRPQTLELLNSWHQMSQMREQSYQTRRRMNHQQVLQKGMECLPQKMMHQSSPPRHRQNHQDSRPAPRLQRQSLRVSHHSRLASLPEQQKIGLPNLSLFQTLALILQRKGHQSQKHPPGDRWMSFRAKQP